MIRHCVMLRLSKGFDTAELHAVFDGLANLCARLPGASGFCAGPNRDFENRSPDYPYGFTIDFVSRAALQIYAENPEHRALGTRLRTLCSEENGITVFDIDTPGTP